MTIDELKKAGKMFGFTVDVKTTGSPDWIRGFIIDSRGVTLGRANFHNGSLWGIKNYKRDYRRDLCETDLLFLRLNRYLKDGFYISTDVYYELMKISKKYVKDDLEAKKKWRREHPKFHKKDHTSASGKYSYKKGDLKSRRKLEGRNVRSVLAQKIMQYQEGDLVCEPQR